MSTVRGLLSVVGCLVAVFGLLGGAPIWVICVGVVATWVGAVLVIRSSRVACQRGGQ